jgi:acyl dehydratase
MGLYFEDFEAGIEYASRSRTVTEADVVSFAGLSGDFNPLHTDAEFAKSSPFGERIAHGMLVVSMATGLINQMGWFDGTTLALLEITARFVGPVKFGDTVYALLTLKEKRESSKPDRGVVIMDLKVLNQRQEAVIEGQQTTLMKRKG